MATVVSANRSEFVNQVIKHYTDNRVGQFSKYLDTDPIFVTYYAVNMAMSRADIGTDAISDIIGPESPIRYNKILKYPVYIKGGFEPETLFENGMISNEMEINDITILPNTLVPRPFDHILVEIPNMVSVLLRVNAYRDLTIQSNDFYSASAHAVEFGENCQKELEKQVVETYTCVFENIGTQNSCFILNENLDKAANLKATVDELKSIYNSIYYDPDVNSYIYNTEFFDRHHLIDPSVDIRQEKPPHFEDTNIRAKYGVPNMGIFDTMPFPHKHMPHSRRRFKRCFNVVSSNIKAQTIYDLYLTKFIKESGIFSTTDNYDVTSAITYEDLIPHTFELDFKRTLWYAVITKSPTLLMDYPYHYMAPIIKEMSDLVLKRYPCPSSVTLVKNVTNHCECNGLSEYFSHELIHDLKNGRASDQTGCKCNSDDLDRDFIDVSNIEDNPDVSYKPSGASLKDYSIEDKSSKEETELTGEDLQIKIFNDIIYAYFNNLNIDINTDQLLGWAVEPSLYLFEYLPILIYILHAKYNSYFVKDI